MGRVALCHYADLTTYVTNDIIQQISQEVSTVIDIKLYTFHTQFMGMVGAKCQCDRRHISV